MKEFNWRFCDEEGTEGLLDVTVEGYDIYLDELEGDKEWLVYYTRFLCDDTEHNREVLERWEEDFLEEEEEENEEDEW